VSRLVFFILRREGISIFIAAPFSVISIYRFREVLPQFRQELGSDDHDSDYHQTYHE
jgi:hypothetical protein